jgi:hypothetical protein
MRDAMHETTPEEEAEARRRRAKALQTITRYILEKYHAKLGYPGGPAQWVGQLCARSEASKKLEHKLAYGVIQQILNGVAGNRTDATLRKLARILSTKPVPSKGPDGLALRDPKNGHVIHEYETVKELDGLDVPQLRLPSLEDFQKWENGFSGSIETHTQELNGQAETHVIYEIPVPVRHTVHLTRDRNEVHYVTWRYAFEDSPDFPRIAREVLTFKQITSKHQDGVFHSTMSYRIGAEDDYKLLRTFNGPVIPLGQSLMCAMTSTDKIPGDWVPEYDRGRAIFLRRHTGGGIPTARFGIVASTRARDGSPCCACMIMLLVDAEITDIEEYRRRVTLSDSEKTILSHDFRGLPERDIYRIKLFLENVPNPYDGGVNSEDVRDRERRAKDGPYSDDNNEHDKVLRLHVERFHTNMPRIRQIIINNNANKNPIKRRWKRSVLLA